MFPSMINLFIFCATYQYKQKLYPGIVSSNKMMYLEMIYGKQCNFAHLIAY